MRIVALVISITLFSRGVSAESFLPPDPPGEDRIVVVEKDGKAPFSGQLFDAETALRWSNWIEGYRLRWQEDVAHEQKLRSIDRQEFESTQKSIDSELEKTRVLYRLQIKKLEAQLESTPFYESFWFGLVTGVVVTSLATVSVVSLSK